MSCWDGSGRGQEWDKHGTQGREDSGSGQSGARKVASCGQTREGYTDVTEDRTDGPGMDSLDVRRGNYSDESPPLKLLGFLETLFPRLLEFP